MTRRSEGRAVKRSPDVFQDLDSDEPDNVDLTTIKIYRDDRESLAKVQERLRQPKKRVPSPARLIHRMMKRQLEGGELTTLGELVTPAQRKLTEGALSYKRKNVLPEVREFIQRILPWLTDDLLEDLERESRKRK